MCAEGCRQFASGGFGTSTDYHAAKGAVRIAVDTCFSDSRCSANRSRSDTTPASLPSRVGYSCAAWPMKNSVIARPIAIRTMCCFRASGLEEEFHLHARELDDVMILERVRRRPDLLAVHRGAVGPFDVSDEITLRPGTTQPDLLVCLRNGTTAAFIVSYFSRCILVTPVVAGMYAHAQQRLYLSAFHQGLQHFGKTHFGQVLPVVDHNTRAARDRSPT